ncbi:prolyl aminopeptidase [Streptomyces poriferorum]|uniref:Proline iminopeptidase n=1 Tax=Streptomyces poriferorum TaxID=2798799 RepID=A0ABY9IPI9_9ACTN|nr:MULTISPECIES: prolyl aminopeptidase [unclassified Streptomyces]MDP5313766.1 prolyl aminopeptidase [Streptomyces sp. Alt4]WLQ57278.1 prolyl aminopeptidase [Streptomyces sp. Alt2]
MDRHPDHKYPPIEPYEHGVLDVGDGNLVYWEACGNPSGKPALAVHGGPGSGCAAWPRRYFDPDRYRVVLFDQRNCGRSTPHASDPAADLRHNTTDHLISDMERLRVHLGVDTWLLFGWSWGSTLALAYAERHPERVSEIVIDAVTTSRRSEIDWLYRGASQFFPDAWDAFRAGVPEAASDATPDVLAAYARRTESPDPEVRARATADWCAWEDAVLSLEAYTGPPPYSGRPGRAQLALVRICARYFSHGAWLEEGRLIRDAGRLAGIPGALVHGRLDMGGPLTTAWELAKAWPDAELTVIEDAGHLGGAATTRAVLAALDGFAR